MSAAPEHGREVVRGLPGPLPAGERMLWQGAPRWQAVLRDVAHGRAVAVGFGLLLAWRLSTAFAAGADTAALLHAAAWTLAPAVLGLSLLALLSWLVARTTVYTITDRRVLMRVGIVLDAIYNLPLAQVDTAALRMRADGGGDIALRLSRRGAVAWGHLWPHVRPWHLQPAEPMLRCLADARLPARLLAEALGASIGKAAPAIAAPRAVGRPAPADAARVPPLAA